MSQRKSKASGRKPLLGTNPFGGPSAAASTPAVETEVQSKTPRARSEKRASRTHAPKPAGNPKPEATLDPVTASSPDASAKDWHAEPVEVAADDQPAPAVEPSPNPEPPPEPAPEPAPEPIRATSAQLDDAAHSPRRARVEHAHQAVDASRFGIPIERPGGEDGGVFDVARELLSTNYYLRQWGRLGMRNRSEVVDDFGHDPKYDARLQPLFDALYTRYFRVQTEGVEHLPSSGRVLIVANHSGALPYDALMLKTAIRREHRAHRPLRWLVENHVFHMPFVGSWFNRLGAVRACQENAERLLRGDQLLAVFPEGHKGQGRLFKERYKLQRFGRGGYIRLCLRTGAPIAPCAIIGAEEGMPLLHKVEHLAGAAGVPFIPVTPMFPWLGPLGLVPAPTRWQIIFGEPIQLEPYGPGDADDDVLVGRLSERVRATIQNMLDKAVGARRSVWFG